jgi:hypothetical protein
MQRRLCAARPRRAPPRTPSKAREHCERECFTDEGSMGSWIRPGCQGCARRLQTPRALRGSPAFCPVGRWNEHMPRGGRAGGAQGPAGPRQDGRVLRQPAALAHARRLRGAAPVRARPPPIRSAPRVWPKTRCMTCTSPAVSGTGPCASAHAARGGRAAPPRAGPRPRARAAAAAPRARMRRPRWP